MTLDLIARTGLYSESLDKAGRVTRKWKREATNDLKTIGKSFAAVGAAAAVGLVAITKNAIDSAREIKNLSSVANTSAESFQRIAFAASKYGIQQDKVADILKDTSDKVGDFLQTGAGPLADFFENIAPMVGVTADEFRNLSGDQALGLYVKSLEAANLSQNEMTFFMEAIASDATLLLPLLRNNGSELERLGDKAEDLNAVLSDVEIEQLDAIKTNIDELKGTFTGLARDIAFETLPAIEELIELLKDPQTIEAAKSLAGGIATAFSVATEAVITTTNVVKFLGEELAAAIHGPAAGDLARLNEELDDLITKREFLQKAIGESGDLFGLRSKQISGIDKEINDLEFLISLYEDQRKIAGSGVAPTETTGTGTPSPTPQRAGRLGKDLNEINEYLKALDEQVELLGKTNTEQELSKLQTLGATEEQLKLARAHLDTIEIFEMEKEAAKALTEAQEEAQKKAAEEQNQINEQASQIAEQLRTEEEMIQDSYERRREIILKNTEVTGQAQTELLRRLEADRQEKLQALEDQRREMLNSGYSALLDVIGEFYDGVEGKEASYVRAAVQLGQVLLDEEKREAIQKIVANTQSAAMGAYESLSTIPIVGPALGAAAAAGIILAGAAAAAKVTGLAHEGLMSVPKTGTYMLEQGERVTTQNTSAKLDRTLDQVQQNQNQQGGGGGNVRIINSFDSEEVVGGYMGSDSGEQMIMNAVKKNQSTIKTLARG